MYRFWGESTKIENALFSYKTAISEANVKTNRIVSTKWTYHKERSFASECFIFLKILISVLEPLIKSCFDVPKTQVHISILFVSAGILFEGYFSLYP